jgi:hypothetical protein
MDSQSKYNIGAVFFVVILLFGAWYTSRPSPIPPPNSSYTYGYEDAASKMVENELISDGLLAEDTLLTCEQLYDLSILYRKSPDDIYRPQYFAGCRDAGRY